MMIRDRVLLIATDGDAKLSNQDELISRVHGIKEVEKYVHVIPPKLKGFMVHTALLNCYARENNVEKAEATFKKLTDIGVMRSPLVFNILMYLYFQTANSDIEGMDKILEKMESNGEVVPGWNANCNGAYGYLKAGIVEKAMTMLKKLEGQITVKTKSIASDALLKLYAKKGNKDELNNILEKAEYLVDHAMIKGSEPSVDAWNSPASGNLEGDQKRAEEFIEYIFSPVALNRLLAYIKGLKSQSGPLIGYNLGKTRACSFMYDSGVWWRNRVSGDNPVADEVEDAWEGGGKGPAYFAMLDLKMTQAQ
ncbi:hypothetical protein SADUNF_Sadunf11G0031000 [Salix dunnii]|uniref:Pentatricopeptide repeat-containing protein n=1 Tax=Salix dunnii TaxID=1413687 RepID=A0A835MWP8_9ROSI|nr:hypothetical protein SADUNF_Sadunf11G0031000 [Salix dunnii]